MWGCHVHNQVNKGLKKAEFDCARVGEVYDCGCGEEREEGEGKGEKKSKKAEKGREGDIRVEVERMG